MVKVTILRLVELAVLIVVKRISVAVCPIHHSEPVHRIEGVTLVFQGGAVFCDVHRQHAIERVPRVSLSHPGEKVIAQQSDADAFPTYFVFQVNPEGGRRH